KDLVEAWPALEGVRFPVLQAPVWTGPTPAPFRAASFADILAVRGFADANGLGALVGAGQALIALTGAEMVVCDQAPSLCLAAFGVLPTVLVAAGLTIPPAEGREFPTLDPTARPMATADRLLETVREVQRRRGRPAPETLPAMLAGS